MPSYESSMRNLAKARKTMRPPRPWRSSDEARMIRRLAFQWFTAPDKRPSGRAWAKALGISHTWLQKLVRQLQAHPTEMYREARRCGDPSFVQLSRAREYSRQMRERGELRGDFHTTRRARLAKLFEGS